MSLRLTNEAKRAAGELVGSNPCPPNCNCARHSNGFTMWDRPEHPAFRYSGRRKRYVRSATTVSIETRVVA